MTFDSLNERLTPDTVLPGSQYIIKGPGRSKDGQRTIVYFIPQRYAQRPSQKNISEDEWKQAHLQLITTGTFTRKWFTKNMKRAANQPCNFKVIGLSFVLLGIATEEPAQFLLRSAT